MKKGLIFLLLAFVSVSSALGQDWQTDFNQAKTLAAEQERPIILVFQGSDWCAPCMKLDREIWSTDEFINYANEHFVMLKADFPKRKANALSDEQTEANGKLAEEYNKNGVFPFVVVLNSDGKVLGETSYKKMTPSAYIDELNAFTK